MPDIKWQEVHPSWGDYGKRVKLLADSGVIVTGIIDYDDVGCDGCDEWPIWRVNLDSGEEVSFYDYECWSFA